MFEHLTPSSKIHLNRKTKDFKFYVSFLFAAIFIFTFSLAISSGPSSEAVPVKSAQAKIFFDDINKQVVIDAPRARALDFIINVDSANIKLEKIKIKVKGLYSPALFADLKLNNEGLQLGQVERVDQAANIYFDFENYNLKPGQNEFSLDLLSLDNVKISDVLEFSISDSSSVVLSYEGRPFTAKASWPLTSGLLSFTAAGSLTAYNNSLDNWLASADGRVKIASFRIDNQNEVIDIKSIKLSSLTDIDLRDASFDLVYKDAIIAQATEDTGEIIFDTNLVSKNNDNIDLAVYGYNIGSGNHNFSLDEVQGVGFFSGKQLGLQESLNLGKIDVRDNLLIFVSGVQDQILSDSWNKAFSFELRPVGEGLIGLEQLAWDIQTSQTEIVEAELWVDGKSSITNAVIGEDKILFSFDQPLVLDDAIQLDLLIKVAELGRHALMSTNLSVADTIWSVDGQKDNIRGLPWLPTDPAVLTR